MFCVRSKRIIIIIIIISKNRRKRWARGRKDATSSRKEANSRTQDEDEGT